MLVIQLGAHSFVTLGSHPYEMEIKSNSPALSTKWFGHEWAIFPKGSSFRSLVWVWQCWEVTEPFRVRAWLEIIKSRKALPLTEINVVLRWRWAGSRENKPLLKNPACTFPPFILWLVLFFLPLWCDTARETLKKWRPAATRIGNLANIFTS